MAEELDDKMAPENIRRRIAEHFEQHPPYGDTDHILREFLDAFVQNAATSPEESADETALDDLDPGNDP